jgi:predicted  nucleic acid-binding Zn-ribbon protein
MPDRCASGKVFMNYPRGSEWRKWNLHIHTPGTALNDQFAGATENQKWENYLQKVEAVPDVAALGVTDYFSIAGYLKLKGYKDVGRIANIPLLLPNVELRILPATGDARAINIHVIFSPDVVGLLDSQFFQDLTFTFDNNSYRCTRPDLIRLGRDFSHDPQKDEKAAYEAGVNQFKVTFSSLRDVLRKNKNLRHKFLVALPNGSQDGNSGLQEASLAATRQEIYRLAHIIFSGRPADVSYFLGEGVDTPDQVKEKCGSIKPCVTGCDAHALDRICTPDEDRFTWIKADPSFEGLRQIVFEPKDRVRIQATNPALEFTKPFFGELSFRHDITVFQPSAQYEGTLFTACDRLPLNPAMVCVIGGRGTGKSCLVDYIGRAFGNVSRRPEITYSDDFIVRFNKDATSIDERGALTPGELPFVYIAQNEVKEKIASGTVGTEIRRMLGLEDLAFELAVETRISELLGNVSKLEAWFAQKNEKGELVYDKDETQRQLARYESLLASITTEQNREKLQRFTANVQRAANLREKEKSLKDLRKDLADTCERLNTLIQTVGGGIPILDFSPQVVVIDKQLEDVAGEVKRCEEENKQTREDFARIYTGDLSSLLANAESYRNAIEKLKQRLAEIERQKAALANAVTALAEITTMIESELNRQKSEIEQTWVRIQAGRADWMPEQRAVMQKILADRRITLETRIVFDPIKFYEKVKAVLNLRYFKASAETSTDQKVQASFNITDASTFLDFMRTRLRTMLGEDYVADARGLNSLFYDLDQRSTYLYVEPQITYGGRPLDKLSVGQKGTVYLCLKLATQPFSQPLLFDQPEDDLDNEFIINELVTIFREIKRFRQVILVTHNANLVVNADSEQVIVATNAEGRLSYKAGGLENPETNLAIRRILEGGDEAFHMRERKYHFIANEA